MTLPILFSKSLLLISIAEKKREKRPCKKTYENKNKFEICFNVKKFFSSKKSDKFKEETEIQNKETKRILTR